MYFHAAGYTDSAACGLIVLNSSELLRMPGQAKHVKDVLEAARTSTTRTPVPARRPWPRRSALGRSVAAAGCGGDAAIETSGPGSQSSSADPGRPDPGEFASAAHRCDPGSVTNDLYSSATAVETGPSRWSSGAAIGPLSGRGTSTFCAVL